jgi:hypothetical protein
VSSTILRDTIRRNVHERYAGSKFWPDFLQMGHYEFVRLLDVMLYEQGVVDGCMTSKTGYLALNKKLVEYRELLRRLEGYA